MNKYLIIIIIAAVLFGLGGVLIKSYGSSEYKRGKAETIALANAAVVEKGKAKHAIEYELRTLDNDMLLRRYCNWLYDTPYDECVQSYNFVK